MRIFALLVIAVTVLLNMGATYAAGDPAAGQSKAVVCDGCHGHNSKNPMAPQLAGQPESYTIQEIHDFRSGVRKDPVMNAMVIPLTNDQDIEDIAAYYAGLSHQIERPKKLSVTLRMGERLYINKCEMCHGLYGKGRRIEEMGAVFGAGKTGKSIGVPLIGGQPKGYLIKALSDYRAGIRKSTYELGMDVVLRRTTEEQIVLVAKYLSSLSKRRAAANPFASPN
jgi:cytochrome c553